MVQPSVPRPRKRFALRGRSRAIDPLRQAVRPDLADVREAESVFAPHYAAPVRKRVERATDLRQARDPASAVIAALSADDEFDLLDITGTTAWGIAIAHGVVGYCDLDALGIAQ